MTQQKPQGIGEIIATSLYANRGQRGAEIAVIGDAVELSNRQLSDLVDGLSSALSGAIDTESIVALDFIDPVKHLIASLALLKMGVTQVSVNPRELVSAKQQFILEANVAFLLQDDEILLFYSDWTVLEDGYWLSVCAERVEIVNQSGTDRAAIIFLGSGTTGAPKMLGVSFITLAHLVKRDLSIRSFEVGDRHYCQSSLFYYTAKRRAIGCLLSGVTVMLPCRKMGRLVEYCRRFRVNHLSLSTTQVLRCLEEERYFTLEESPKLPMLKTLFVGSSSVSEAVRSQIRSEITENLFVVYGSNEFGEATVANLKYEGGLVGTVGHPCSGVKIDIVDAQEVSCDIGIVGRIRLKSAYMMRSYINDEVASLRTFANEAYYPGDLGSLSETGQLIFFGREDDMMIFQGVNIFPREIESILETHSSVLEAAAFPLMIAGHEGVPFAVVSLKKAVSETQLLGLCKKSLAWRSPKRIFFIKEFPRNIAGKILKKELARLVEANLRR